ncbi:MAG: YdgA family protein [Azoarcus sp.]|jgi:uncharacterized protein YdgA (DUF945 family)|nr:YdgA family protein [Azoarcus sp.]
MSKSLKVIGVAVVVAGLVVVGGSYATGFFFKSGFQSHLERENLELQARSGDKVGIQLERYEHGLFGATARTRVMAGPVAVLFINHDIRHGLGTGFRAYGKVHSEVALPQEVSIAMNALFGGDPLGGQSPLTVESVIGWTGDNRHVIKSPDFKAKAMGIMNIAWGGIDGDIAVRNGHRDIAWRINLPGFSMKDDKEKVEIGRLYSKGGIARAGEHLFWTGQMALEFDKIALDIRRKASFPSRFELRNLEFSTDTRDNDGLVESTFSIAFDKVAAAGETADAAKLTFAFEQIDADALDAFIKIVQSLQRKGGSIDPDAFGNALAAQQSTLAPAFLRRKPVIALKDSRIRLKQGDLRIDARLSYIGENPEQFDSERDLLLEANGGMSRALLAHLATSKMKDSFNAAIDDEAIDEALTEEMIGELAAQLVDQQITELINQGYLIEKDGLLTATLRFQGATMTLNGKPWDENENLFPPMLLPNAPLP